MFTGVRCIMMDHVLFPIAARLGIERKRMKTRFAEQAWILIYPGFSWTCGMYILVNSPYFKSLHALWHDWPTRELSGLHKWYYLVQFAFWLQQIVVVNIEQRRKDHWQMFSHHVITCALIFLSYGYHQTRVGNLILCLMDVVDLFLPLAKIFKYLNFGWQTDVTFGVFMVTWFIARHVIYLTVCYSIWKHIPEEISYGCYKGGMNDLQGPLPVPKGWDHLTQPFRNPVGLVCWNDNIRWVFLGLLLALQVILVIWFIMILRVAYKVLSGRGAEDSRSDDEDEEDEEEEIIEETVFHNVKKQLSQVHLNNANSFSNEQGADLFPTTQAHHHSTSPIRKSPGTKTADGQTSGVNFPINQKELLGRIGCDHKK